MRYRFVRPLPLLLDIIICSLGIGCSNSESVDYAGWEYSYNDDSEEDAPIEPQKQGCFNNFRLPDLQSIACQKKFYSYSGQHKPPEWN